MIGYQAYLKSTSTTLTLANVKTKALSVSMKVLSTIGWMAIFTAASWAIGKGIEAIENYIHRLDNAKETLASTESDLSSVKSEIETTTDKIKELEAMDSLSITDKEDLQRLKDQNEELRIRQQYLEKQKQYDAEKVADYTKEKYNSQYGSTTQEDVDKYRSLYGNNNKNTYTSVDEYGAPTATSYYAGNQTDEYGVSTGLNSESKDLANLIAQYQYYQEEKAKAVTAQDQESVDKWDAKLKETSKDLMGNRTTLQGFSDDLSATGKSSVELDGITEKLKLIDDLLLSPGQKLVNFINSDAIKEDKEQLVVLADSGKLTSKALSENFSSVDKYLKENGLTIEDLITVVKTYKDDLVETGDAAKASFMDLFTNLPVEKLEEYVGLIKSGDINENTISSFSELNDMMKETGASSEEAIKGLENFTKSFVLSPDLISEIQDAYDLLEKTKDEYKDSDVIGLSTLGTIAKTYPTLTSAVNEYTQGLISADDMMGQLQAAYDNDAVSFRSAMAYKLSGNESFFSEIKDNNQTLFDKLATAYGLDVQNWKSMAQAKAEIDQQLIRNLSDAWSKYYNIVVDATSGLASIEGVAGSKPEGAGGEMSKAQRNALDAAFAATDRYNDVINRLNEAANIQVEIPDFNGIGSADKTGSGKDKSDTVKQIDWIERGTKVLQDEYAKLEELANKDTIAYLGLTQEEFDKAKSIFDNGLGNTTEGLSQLQSYADKAGLSLGELYTMIQSGAPNASKESALQSMLKMQTETLLPRYQQEVEAYSKAYEDALKAIPSEYKDKIENGGVDIESLPSDLAEKVQTAIDANDKLKASEKQLADGEADHIETIKELHENRIAAIDIENEKLEQSNKIIKSQMELMEARGEIVDADFYKRQIKNNKGLISGDQQNIAEWESEMADLRKANVSTDSKDYKELQAKVKAAKNEIQGLKLDQEEYNQKLEQMPIDNLNTAISMYKDIATAIENWGDVASATGEKLNADYYQTLISNGAKTIDQYQELASEIENVMDDQEEGSTRWNELYEQLQSVNSEMSSMVQNLKKWNEELLKMPLENISNYSSELQKVADGLSKVQSEQDQVISAVTGAIKEQIDLLNEQGDLETENRQSEIDALKEKLYLLDKENEYRKLQYDLEQKQFELERARNQKTTKAVRDGKIDYEKDAQAEREAQQNLLDSQYNLEKYNLQGQIDKAQESLDSYNDGLQDQIDSLQKISDKWSEINEKIVQGQNEDVASSILGSDWKDKVLSGNDTALFNTFSGMYANTAEQLKRYQDQIDSTNNIQSLLEDYVNSYKEGTITYDEALKGINGLLSQLNKTMSATGNLQNIFDYLGTVNDTAANADAVLVGIQSGLKDTATELLKSLEQYNKNSGMISEYTSSWQQLTDNVASMLDVLKEVRNNLEDALDNSDDDDDDNDNTRYGGGKDGSPGTPGKGEYVNSGPGVSRKDGITRGLIGSTSDSDREASMKLLGLRKLDPDEIPAVLHMGEAVFNKEQQQKILENFGTAWNYKPSVPDYSSLLSNVNLTNKSETPMITLNGGINIQKSDTPDELAKGIMDGKLGLALGQRLGKR